MLPLLLAWLLTPSTLPAIRVSVFPYIQVVSPGKAGRLTVRLTIPHDPANRQVCLVVDGPTYSESCWWHREDAPVVVTRSVSVAGAGVGARRYYATTFQQFG